MTNLLQILIFLLIFTHSNSQIPDNDEDIDFNSEKLAEIRYVLSFAEIKQDREKFSRNRKEIEEMFDHAYHGYLHHAFPMDELKPLRFNFFLSLKSDRFSLLSTRGKSRLLSRHI